MALINLKNITKPIKLYDEKTKLTDIGSESALTYIDLHLDLTIMRSVGLGVDAINSGDIMIDYDLSAIKNSIRNLFTTKKGQKILNPDFGCSLDQYLFTPISNANGKAIASEILRAVTKYEPRIQITNIYVVPVFDQSLYKISVYYSLLDINKQNIINIIAILGGQLTIE